MLKNESPHVLIWIEGSRLGSATPGVNCCGKFDFDDLKDRQNGPVNVFVLMRSCYFRFFYAHIEIVVAFFSR